MPFQLKNMYLWDSIT